MTDLLRTATIQDAAARLGVCRSKLYAMQAAGEVRFVRFGRVVRVPMAEIARLLEPVDGRVDGTENAKSEKIELFPRVSA